VHGSPDCSHPPTSSLVSLFTFYLSPYSAASSRALHIYLRTHRPERHHEHYNITSTHSSCYVSATNTHASHLRFHPRPTRWRTFLICHLKTDSPSTIYYLSTPSETELASSTLRMQMAPPVGRALEGVSFLLKFLQESMETHQMFDQSLRLQRSMVTRQQ
jgi:hypothetical protein